MPCVGSHPSPAAPATRSATSRTRAQVPSSSVPPVWTRTDTASHSIPAPSNCVWPPAPFPTRTGREPAQPATPSTSRSCGTLPPRTVTTGVVATGPPSASSVSLRKPRKRCASPCCPSRGGDRDGQARVADPGVAVVELPVRPRGLREAGRHRCDDGPRRPVRAGPQDRQRVQGARRVRGRQPRARQHVALVRLRRVQPRRERRCRRRHDPVDGHGERRPGPARRDEVRAQERAVRAAAAAGDGHGVLARPRPRGSAGRVDVPP